MSRKTKIILSVVGGFCFLVMIANIVLSTIKVNYYQKDLDLPRFDIAVAGNQGIFSKEEYLDCKVSVSNADEEFEFKNEEAEIKGRGNSTWTLEKKPYKLKFKSKVDLFGNGSAKTWTLIANHSDKSLIRNYLAYTLATEFNSLKFTTTTKFVDLYVNGKYQGVYLVCEQTEVKENRVEIEDGLETFDTGYLLELDCWAPNEGENGVDYFYAEGKPFAIKSPDTEDEMFSSGHVNFIKGYLNDCFEALKGTDFEAVDDLIDVESFAESYILNELFKTTDVFQTSFYVYKDAGGKLCSGPVWDYDLSSGNCQYDNHSTETDYLYAAKNIFYKYLLEFDEFQNLVTSKVAEYKDILRNKIVSEIDYIEKNYSRSFERNFIKWKIMGEYVFGNSKELVEIDTWKGQTKYLKNWLLDSLDFIEETYN